MSQLAHTPTTSARIRSRIPILGWAALALATAAVATVLALALSSGDTSSRSAQSQSAPPVARSSSPNVRYDGGPEEGTAGPFGKSLAPVTDR